MNFKPYWVSKEFVHLGKRYREVISDNHEMADILRNDYIFSPMHSTSDIRYCMELNGYDAKVLSAIIFCEEPYSKIKNEYILRLKLFAVNKEGYEIFIDHPDKEVAVISYTYKNVMSLEGFIYHCFTSSEYPIIFNEKGFRYKDVQHVLWVELENKN